jgi:hypothetical protein
VIGGGRVKRLMLAPDAIAANGIAGIAARAEK